MLKNQKGITLVALVITIVILIILATVAITFAFGGNGLITRAEQAEDFQANADAQFNEFTTNTTTFINKILENAGITE